jgi:hypothetical protein
VSPGQEESDPVTGSKRFIATLALTGSIGASFVVGQMTGLRSAQAAATQRYVLRLGDKVSIPAINQVCAVSTEGGAVDLFCARPRNPYHQVTIFRDNIFVWKVGNPDRPAWAGKP